MSDIPKDSDQSEKGKESAIADLATHSGAIAPQTVAVTTELTQEADAPGEDIFALASKIEALLKGKSNKTCHKVLNMVGSIHGIRAIPADRPIGQSTKGTTKVVPIVKPAKKGMATPPAAWKQSDRYRDLAAQRETIVKTIKSLAPDELANKLTHVEELRELEQQLKSLKSSTSGNH